VLPSICNRPVRRYCLLYCLYHPPRTDVEQVTESARRFSVKSAAEIKHKFLERLPLPLGLWVGRAGPLPRALTSRGGAEKAVTDRSHVNTYSCSMVISWFANEKSRKEFFFKFGCIGLSRFWYVLVFTYVYSCYALRLLLQILFVAALDIKTRYVPTVSSINSVLSQYCKASHFFANFYVCGGGGRQLFALSLLSHGQRPALVTN
jgi:hypothetical protein